jgi:hypothetical protein
VQEPLLQAFPFPSTGKGDTAPALSGLCVYLQFMWDVGLSPSPLKFSSHCHFQKLSCSCLLGGAAAPAGHHVCLQFTWEVGLPFSPVEFSSLLHSHKLPAPGCWVHAPLPPEPLRPARIVYLQSREGFPSPNLQRSGRPTLFPACLNCSYCLLLSFSFFPWVEVSLSRGLCCSGPGLSVGVPRYHEAHLVCVFPVGAGHWRLVSPFNVKWRFSAPAGDVEGLKLCLFSVIMPAKCVSSISPRFHYRRVTFCFLPLAAILESPIATF